MAAWVTKQQPSELFDPAVGPGTFFAAARAVGYSGPFEGFELHPSVLGEGMHLGLRKADFAKVRIGDFLGSEFSKHYAAIISNPPYIRHHRLGESRKQELKAVAADFAIKPYTPQPHA
jgi:hypothetical protein